MQAFQITVAPYMEMNLPMETVIEEREKGLLTIPVEETLSSLIAAGQDGIIHFADNRCEPVRIFGLEKKAGRLHIRCRAAKTKQEAA
jgi:hypothetical protein